ncbi:MAG: AAA family ATPase [Candidatus Peribacteraceae bacterium]|nr:AAA family ATPase [Candidatus Peribacteraceae bacterium]
MSYNPKIKEFGIKNFRAFEELIVHPEADEYICIVGRNGSGKTSVLEALNICLSENNSKFNNIQETDFRCDEPIELTIKFDKPFFLSFEDGNLNRLIPCDNIRKTISRRSRKEAGSFFSPSFDVKTDFYPSDYNPTSTEHTKLKEIISKQIDKNEHLVRRFQKTPLDQRDAYGSKEYQYSTIGKPDDLQPVSILGIRYLPRVLFPKVFYFDKNRSRELLADYNTTFSKVLNELDWRFKKEFLKLEEDKSSELFNDYNSLKSKLSSLENYKEELVNPVVTSMHNNLDIIFEGELEFFFFNLYCPYKTSVFGHKTTENQIIPVSNYGSGISSLMALTFLIEFAKHTKESILILIDEPEIHLQSDLQKKLYRFLKRISFQTILSSHSHLFLDKEIIKNNFNLERNSEGKLAIKRCNQLEFADAQFRLLGNSLDDFFIPDNILLVEGKFDKFVLSKCLILMGKEELSLQILDCGGYAEIPNKADRYDQVLNNILRGTTALKEYIKKNLRIIADGDVDEEKIKGWKRTFNLTDDKVFHLKEWQKGLEYLYPESLIRSCVEKVTLKTGADISTLTKDEIIAMIFNDDKIEEKSLCAQVNNRMTKKRLNKFVEENLSIDILNSNECVDLKLIIDWIISI